MRRDLFLGLVICCLIATIAFAHYPGTLTIDAAAKKQPPVTFDHARHGETLVKSCDTCHHTQPGLTREQADSVDVKRCSQCHLDPQDDAPSMREASVTRNPLHIRCIECHKEEKKGPTTCTTCHVKAE